MIKAVVFDLDHTLFDRHSTLRAIVPMLRRRFSVNENMTDGDIGDIWCEADDTLVYSGWENIHKSLCEKGVFVEMPSFEDYREFLLGEFHFTAAAFPETVPMLSYLREKGYKTGLITNGYSKLQNAKIDLLGIRELFTEIIITGDYEIHKPDTRIFDIMREKLSLNPEEIVYVGDNPVNDIIGARNAGWKTVWIKSTGYWDDSIQRAHAEVNSVTEIINAINDAEE